ncbi:MAG: ATPase [Candidatus Nomurabacteria bacterium]|nr:ATPase [Candidatus Nomurabacteria bacterium]USN87942.1 MAG: ATPase [Candidatus Nomurabacteria bacterium]
MQVQIIKADGSVEYFKVEKLRRSLRRAGAAPDEVNSVVAQIGKEIYDGIRTQEIYRRAFELLKRNEIPAAARYSLRRALFSLGPTGFPFEKFLGRLFELDGYSTRTGLVIQGHCAPHEIDIAAFHDSHSFVGEAKFHARPGIKSDLQVAMYSYARLLDLRDQSICHESICGISEFWLVTNTKFTSTAEKYGECVGLKMLSWDYPRRDNLHDRIQRAGIYPVTVLQNLSTAQIETLIEYDVIVCSDLVKNPRVLKHLHLSAKKQEQLIDEAREICKLPR